MRGNDRHTVWLAVGVGGAIAVGVGLIPLRSVTTASNLAFAFVAFTIVVAELGGRGPGLATAVTGALSLNFFLTEPYLTLAIEKPGDIVAFFAMAACGLIAAAFGERRVRTAELVGRTRLDLEVLSRTVERLAAAAPLDETLDDLRRSFGLSGLVLRRADGSLVAAAPPAQAGLPSPETELESRALFGAESRVHRLGPGGFRLPEGGGRLRLGTRRGPLLLDLWEGSPVGLGLDERQALGIAATIIALAPLSLGAPDSRRA